MFSQHFVVTLDTLGDPLYSVLILLFEFDSLICFGACFGDMYLFCGLVFAFVFLLFGAGSLSATGSFSFSIELLSATGGL